MKKVIALIAVLIMIMSIVAVASAENTSLDLCTKLLTTHEWVYNTNGYVAQKGGSLRFDKMLPTIHLPQKNVFVTAGGDGTLYITCIDKDALYNFATGIISFDAEYETMTILVDTAFAIEVYVYTRK